MNSVKGDLIQLALDGQFDVIVHGCNCFHTMGAGIAKSIRSTFPEAYAADRQTPHGDLAKLGTVSYAKVVRNGKEIVVVNAYTQFNWQGNGLKADYDAIRSVMKTVKESFPGLSIGYPQIGAGLAKGDWNKISSIISEELNGTNHTLVEYQPAPKFNGRNAP
jgi:O-acetyl-ADP-ribose deacetylase (regulator of RNase III)